MLAQCKNHRKTNWAFCLAMVQRCTQICLNVFLWFLPLGPATLYVRAVYTAHSMHTCLVCLTCLPECYGLWIKQTITCTANTQTHVSSTFCFQHTYTHTYTHTHTHTHTYTHTHTHTYTHTHTHHSWIIVLIMGTQLTHQWVDVLSAFNIKEYTVHTLSF